jgi:antitoxin (DNA-binding transcriptional repressor) of toxin-antitoxin stability system
MKSITVPVSQADWPELLRAVEAGSEVKLTKQRRTVARIVPVEGNRTKVNWSDTWRRADEAFGGKLAKGKPGSQVVIDGRR